MHNLVFLLPVTAVIVLALVAKGRFDRARRRRKAQRSRRYWAAYEAAWAIVHGRRRFKRLTFHQPIEEIAE